MKTLSEITQSLKNYFAEGFLHKAINISSTNIYKMFAAIAQVFYRESKAEAYFKREVNPETTYDLILDWEKEVKIPCECFTTDVSIDQRKKQVLVKLTANVQIAQDFVDLAKILGVTITMRAKNEGATPFPLLLPYSLVDISNFYVIIVDIANWSPSQVFPFLLPYPLGQEQYSTQIQCLFNKLKPANCLIEYI